ncbi:MAG: efflux RND transporter permease subunit [Candidatus Aminicenantes bacterium]|nr:efflux RND transporter permease subunit [Candidatus Aminicenantes bacterium]
MKNKKSWLEILLGLKQILFLFVGLFVLVGILALIKMPRDEFPEFKIRQGIVIGIYPGASSLQVEEQLTSKVEEYLFQYHAVNRSKTWSMSKENVMVIYVDVSEKEKNPDEFWLKLRHGLNELKKELPSGVNSLTADNDFGSASAVLLAVQSDTKTYPELEACLERFASDVRKVESVSRVKQYGMRKEQVSVYVDDAKLTHSGIKPLLLLAALQAQSSVGYAGEIDDGKLVYPIHVPLAYKTETDIANQIVYSDPAGNVVRLKDVARVVREYDEPDSDVRVNGKKCLLVSLEMHSGNNVVQFGREVGRVIDEFTKSLPPDIRLIKISDVPNAVSTAVTSFLKEFAIAVIAVILVTLILLPTRVALVAASAIPISILSTLGIMWAAGMDLQTVSLAGLTIVLGIVVDDAIVIIDNYVEKLDHQVPRDQAASQAPRDLCASVFTATLIIIACFIPIRFFMKGSAADFLRSLPLAIGIPLALSLVVSVVIVPLLCYDLIKRGVKGDASKGRRAAFLNGVQAYYDRLIEKAFRKKALVVAVGAASLVLGLVILAGTPQQAFPKIARNQFAVEVALPEGTSLQQTDAVIRDLEGLLKNDPRVRVVASFVGTSSPRFHALYAPQFPSKNYGQLVVLTESNDATEAILDEYSRKYRQRYPIAEIRWKQLEFSPIIVPIEVRISGDSIPAIKGVADQVQAIIRPVPGVYSTTTDFRQPLQTINLDVRRDEAARMGYSTSLMNYSLMVGTKGFLVATVWEGDTPVAVKLKVDKKTKTAVADIANQYVTSPFVVSSVPLRQLADLKPGWTEGVIIRRNGVRTITVQADVDRGLYASRIIKKIKPAIDALPLPPGVHIEYGGELQNIIEYITPIYYAFLTSVIMIFLILMVHFRKIKTSLLIMATMPLTIFGAALGVFITGYPFSAMAFIGVIGLTAIVIRNGIIYVTYAEELCAEHGHTVEEAAIAAAKRRMRPIFLTASAAAVGVIPMVLSGSSLWGPMGAVICFGLMAALVLTLLVLPVLYYYAHRPPKRPSPAAGEAS